MASGPETTHSALKVFLFTDIVGSTEFKRILGDRMGAEVIARHDALFRDCLAEHGGEESGHSGDGFFALFDLPSAALRCALAFNLGLQKFSLPIPLKTRIGLHVGEFIMLSGGGTGGTQDKPIGLAVDLASRVMELAEPGQVLMTRAAFDSCRQQIAAAPNGQLLHWMAHGQYLFKGLDEPIEIYEAGIDSVSPLAPPSGKAKAIRAISPEEEETLGWRPAIGHKIPQRENWELERKLGEGGFGEVWLARQVRTGDLRTFKFCFRADRLRTLKRELTLFRLIKEVLGERQDIARLIDVKLDAPPYFLEMEYTAGGDIKTWAESRNGIAAVPLPTRLELAAQIAGALAAAHSVGVIHKDVKPRNVLVYEHPDGRLQARLTDFGIGQLLAPALESDGRKLEGFSTRSSTVLSELGSRTGTRVYMAPELLAGREPSIQSDIFAFGVLLYQFILGDLDRPLGQGWERNIGDELLRETITGCVDGDPERRFASALEPADQIKNLEDRRAARRAEQLEREAAARAARLRKALAWGMAASLAVVVFASLFAVRERRRAEREAALKAAVEEGAYRAQIRLATSQTADGQIDLARETAWETPERLRGWEWGHQISLQYGDLYSLDDRPIAHYSPSGKYIVSASRESDIELRDALDGKLIRTFARREGLPLPLAFSADEKLLAAGAPDGTIRIYNVADGQTLRDIDAHDAVVRELLFAGPEGSLVSGSQDGTVRVWNPATGALVRQLAGPGERQVYKLAAGYEGAHLAASLNPTDGGDGRLSIWESSSGTQVLDVPGDWFSFSRTRPLVAVANDASVTIYDLSSRTPIGAWPSPGGAVSGLEFAPDGELLAAALADGTIYFLTMKGTPSGPPLRGIEPSSYMAFTPDSKRLAVASYSSGRVSLWDVRARKILGSVHAEEYITSCQMRPQGDQFLTPSNRLKTRVWPTKDFPGARAITVPEAESEACALSAAHDVAAILSPGRTAYVFDPRSGQNLTAFAAFSPPVFASERAMALTPDGKLLAVALDQFVIFVLDVETGAIVSKFAEHEGLIYHISIDPAGEAAVSTSWDNTARIWNLKTGNQIAILQGHKSDVLVAAFSPDGTKVLTGSEDGEVKLWDRAAASELRSWQEKSGAIVFAGFSPDGRMGLIGARGALGRIYDLETGGLRQELKGHAQSVRWIGLSPDNSRLLTAGGDGNLMIRDAQTGENLLTIQATGYTLNFAGFDSSSGDLLTSGRDGALHRWTAAPWRSEDLPGDPAKPWRERFEALDVQEARETPAAADASETATLHIYVPRASFDESLARLIADVTTAAPGAAAEEDFTTGASIESEARVASVALLCIHQGDRILAASGRRIDSRDSAAAALRALAAEIDRLPAGVPALTLTRLGTALNVRFHFVEPEVAEVAITVPRGELLAFLKNRRDYLVRFKARAIEINQRSARNLGILPDGPESMRGLWPFELDRRLPAKTLPRFGLANGDRITSIAGVEITDFASCLAAFDAGIAASGAVTDTPVSLASTRGALRRTTIRFRRSP